jgi:hypothetical protein
VREARQIRGDTKPGGIGWAAEPKSPGRRL